MFPDTPEQYHGMQPSPDAAEPPQPVRSYHSVECNTPMLLYSGAADVLFGPDRRLASSRMTIAIEWFPVPRVALTADFPGIPFLEWSDESVVVELPVGRGQRNGLPLTFAARLLATRGRPDGPGSQADFVATQSVSSSGRDDALAASIHVHIVNCLDFMGREVTNDGRNTTLGRLSVSNEHWTAVLDPVPGAGEALQQAMLRSGYAVTHMAAIKPTGGLCSLTLARELVEELSSFLSLVTGSRVGSFVITGYDTAQRELWTIWHTHNGEPYHGNHSPLPRAYENPNGGFGAPDLSPISQRFVALRRTPASGRVLQRLESWYVRALIADDETASMFAAAGLELLSYWHLVAGQGLSALGFDRLTAADRLRLLLAACQVDFGIPPILETLTGFVTSTAKKGQVVDGPWCVTEFRNGVVHPPTRPRQYVDDPALLAESSWLALWYFDLALLRLLDYKGAYRNRVAQDGAAQMVPWMQADAAGIVRSWM